MGQDHAIYLFTVVVSGLFGLAIGSFLNVVIYRLPRGFSLASPPSHCPNCGTELRSTDNIPILSWILLGQRCRYCKEPISVRYPIVELLTAASYVGIAAAIGWSGALVPVLVVVSITLVGSAISFDEMPIPRSLLFVDLAACAALAIVAVGKSNEIRIGWAALGALAVGAVFAGVAMVAKIEYRRSAVLVMCLGWTVGWFLPLGIFLLALAALVLGSTVAVFTRRLTHKGPVLLTSISVAAYALICVGAVHNGP